MECRFLGKTGLKVSEICFGPGHIENPDEGDAVRLIEAALDAGVTLFDWANLDWDGQVDEWMGKALRSRRDEVVLAVRFSGDATRKYIVRECEKSLKRLNTDYIDLYQFHHWQPTVAVEESLEALTALVRQGKVLYTGCTWFKPYQIANALRVSERRGYTKLAAVGARYNLLGQDVFSPYVLGEVQEFDLIPFCTEEQLGLVAFAPLAGGLLTGKYRPGEPPPADSRYARSAWYVRPDFVEKARPLLEVVERLRPLAERRGETLTQFALAWVLSRPVVSSVAIGAQKPEQIRACAEAAGRKLCAQELREVDEIRGGLPGCVTVPSTIEKRWIERGYRQV